MEELILFLKEKLGIPVCQEHKVEFLLALYINKYNVPREVRDLSLLFIRFMDDNNGKVDDLAIELAEKIIQKTGLCQGLENI